MHVYWRVLVTRPHGCRVDCRSDPLAYGLLSIRLRRMENSLRPRTRYVTNGGYGGVQYALRYGVPIVATGGKEDKPEVGAASGSDGLADVVDRLSATITN